MRLWLRSYFGHNVDLEVVFFKTTTLAGFFEMIDPEQDRSFYLGCRLLNNAPKHLTLLELGAEDGDAIFSHEVSDNCFFLHQYMVLTLQKGSSQQNICVTKNTTVENFFHLLIVTRYAIIGMNIGTSILRITRIFI